MGACSSVFNSSMTASLSIYEPLSELWSSAPRQHGYFLGNFAALERDDPERDAAVALVTAQINRMRAAADQIGAEVLIAMIPAPVQVCGADALAYYPRHVNLNDAERYDPDLPQRLTQQLARETGVLYHDLRPVLQAADQCPYMARNMHWQVIGHELIAGELGQVIRNIRGTSP